MKRIVALAATVMLAACSGGGSSSSSSAGSTSGGSHGASSGSTSNGGSSGNTASSGNGSGSTSNAGTDSGSTSAGPTGSGSNSGSTGSATDSGSTSAGSTSSGSTGNATDSGSTGSGSGSDSGSSGSSGSTGVAIAYSVGGTVDGLTADGLVLQNNGADDLAVPSGATTFTFSTPLATGAAYAVTVSASPAGLTCTVANGSGNLATANVGDVAVTCVPATYTVGGTVTGLTGDGLVLQNNGADDLPVANGATSFTFTAALADGAAYAVTVLTPPTGETCTVTNGSGNLAGANVTDVAIACAPLPPMVVSSNPAPGDTAISEGLAEIDVYFDQAMDEGTTHTIALQANTADGGPGAVDTANAFWANGDTSLSLNFLANKGLERGHDYTLDLTGLNSAAGVALDGLPYLTDGKLHFHTIIKHSEPAIDLNALLASDGDGGYVGLYDNTNGPEPIKDVTPSCATTVTGDLVFRYTVPTAAQTVTVSLGGTTFQSGTDSVLSAYAENAKPELGCNDDAPGLNAGSKLTVPSADAGIVCFHAGDVIDYVVTEQGTASHWGAAQVHFGVSLTPPAPADTTVVAQTPADGATDVSQNGTVSISFGTAIDRTKGGTVTFQATSGTQVVDLAAPGTATVSWNGNTLTVTPPTHLALSDQVQVTLAGATFADCLSTAVPTTTWSFTVRDTVSLTYLTDGFETCAGWTLTGQWSCGAPTNPDGPAAYAGTNVLAVGRTATYLASAAYASNTATSPAIDLTTSTAPVLSFMTWLDTETGWDGFKLQASTDGTTFTDVTTVSPAYYHVLGSSGPAGWSDAPSSPSWQAYSADLSSYVGHTVFLRFAFASDSGGEDVGVFLDNLFVGERAAIPLTISSTSFNDAAVGYPYSKQLSYSGGTTAAVWSITGGTAASWLTISATGALSGTPTASDVGPATLTVHVQEPTLPTNFADATYNFNVRATAPTVTSLTVTSLPSGYHPGLGIAVSNGNVYFSVSNSSLNTSKGTAKGGIGYVPTTGGDYTSVFTEGGSTSLDPQAIFVSGSNLYAFNGFFGSPLGTAGLYQVTGATTAVAKSTAAAPYSDASSLGKYGYAVNGDNFYLAQYFASPYDILGANAQVSSAVAMTNVTNGSTSFSGPYGVAASSTKLYAFDTSLYMYDLSSDASPAVPSASNKVTVGTGSALGGTVCNWYAGSTGQHILTALDSPTNPTKLYFTNWGEESTGSRPVNRICAFNLDSNGVPTGTAYVVAGAASGSAAAGSADATGDLSAASFEKVSAMTYDPTTQALYLLQRSNSASSKALIRVIKL